MKHLYFDCFSGISGDMCLGALINAGADSGKLEKELRRLPLQQWEICSSIKDSHGISGTRAEITVAEEHQPHRHYSEIRNMILECPLPEKVKTDSLKIFQKLAEAEGKVHGVSPDQVHFHEVGAVDSILDIVGTCLAISFLKIERITCSPLPPGKGYVKCRHGLLPVPAPATAELLKGVPIAGLDVYGELVTPTGAAIVTSLAESFGHMPEMVVETIGYGLGQTDPGITNFLRIFIGDNISKAGYKADTIMLLETNIDDMNPQLYGHIADMLFNAGALDVFCSPIMMKKNRPAFTLTVMCAPGKEKCIIDILLHETTTLGVRYREEKRSVLERKIKTVATPYGKVRIKYAEDTNGNILKSTPEHDDCRKIAAEKSIPLRIVYEEAMFAFRQECKQKGI